MWIRKVGIGALRKTLLIVGLFAGVSLIAATARADTVINFDNVPDGTVINNEYSGVTFSCNVAGGGCQDGANVYARSGDAASPGNVLSSIYMQGGNEVLPWQSDTATGAILVQFATAQSAVSIDASPSTLPEAIGSPGYAYLEAFDSSGNLLGLVEDSTLDQYTTLSISADSISTLLIGDVENGAGQTFSEFDNLCYSSDASGCGASGNNNGGGGGPTTPTPEPSSLLLMASGLGVVGFTRKFRKA